MPQIDLGRISLPPFPRGWTSDLESNLDCENLRDRYVINEIYPKIRGSISAKICLELYSGHAGD